MVAMPSEVGEQSDESDRKDDHDSQVPKLILSGANLKSSAKINDEGRFTVNFDADTLIPANILPPPAYSVKDEAPLQPAAIGGLHLNILVQIVGSRGDVQPFIALGNELQLAGHRVRIATHDVFKDFVCQSGLEFYPIGGDPSDLMSYMVRNPGIIPKMATVRAGEISRKRKMIGEMLEGCWQSCFSADPATGHPFVAEAIIANPPSFAHLHCAQALGIPLHNMFTMPWSPTRAFPHPLANVRRSNVDPRTSNYLSYGMIELLTWNGLADVINGWRVSSLDLDPIPLGAAAGIAETLKIPYTYCWSPALVPKPADWPSYIDVCGFFFRQEPVYTPPPQIEAFLGASTTTVYIGFGSIVLDDPTQMTRTIEAAIKKLGIRAIVSRGWSNLGSDVQDPNILFIEDCPHEWLFKNVAAVVHHGGAGTTACGLLNGCPTTIVPFFGDQPFWGEMVAAAGAGPRPIHHKSLTPDNLAEAIQFCLTPTTKAAAGQIAMKMRQEDGVKTAVASFHRHLPANEMRCDLLPDENAAWRYNKGKKVFKLSDRAIAILLEHKKIEMKDLKLYKPKPIVIENKRWDPMTATSSALLGTMVDFSTGLGTTVINPVKGLTKMGGSLVKGALVDVPLALTDGLAATSNLVGGKERNRGTIDDWKSGSKEAGKNFYTGFRDGLSGIVAEPYEGAKTEGAWGFTKGLATGSVGLFTKPGSAMFGLFAYPSLGIYKSLASIGLTGAESKILAGRLLHGEFMAMKRPVNHSEVSQVLHDFGGA